MNPGHRVGQWSAPGRVNLLGDHVDYNGGPVLPIAIERRTRVTVRRRDDNLVTISSDTKPDPARFSTRPEPGQVDGWAAYAAGVCWALGQAGHSLPGVDLHVSSDIPEGAGLSSSAALECAVAVALRDVADLAMDDLSLALLAQRAENDYVGVPCGAMDQIAVMSGKSGHALLIETTEPSVRAVPADWAADGLRLVVVDTRVSHALTGGEYAGRRRECDRAAASLGVEGLAAAETAAADRLSDPLLRRRVRHVTTEVARVREGATVLASRDWPRLGELFTASHASLRDNFEVSSDELDTVVETALRAGALGARMTGAGFGGSAVALLPQRRVTALETAVRGAFAAAGWREPTVFAVTPASGAHKDG